MQTFNGTSEKPIRELDIVKMVDALNGDEKMFVSIDVVLKIIDSMIDSDEFHNHNENAVCRQIKNRVLALKGELG